VLTIVKEAAEQARMLIGRANQEVSSLAIRQGIIEMVSTIITYKFTKLSRQEIDAMLGTKFEETRVYRETREEGKEEAQLTIALNLLRENIPIEVIARTTNLSIEQLQALQAQNN
jgi:predicted transposase YdaD